MGALVFLGGNKKMSLKNIAASMCLFFFLTACGAGESETSSTPEGQTAGDCTDEADNDGDGDFDCNDSGCAGAPACQEEASDSSDASDASDATDATDVAADNPPSISLQSVAEDDSLLQRVISGVRGVFDPEIPLNIYDLGLIYRIDISADNQVAIDMTLTSPMCPVAGSLPGEVENAAREVAGVADVVVELVWDPPWAPEVMSEAARLELGFF